MLDKGHCLENLIGKLMDKWTFLVMWFKLKFKAALIVSPTFGWSLDKEGRWDLMIEEWLKILLYLFLFIQISQWEETFIEFYLQLFSWS